VKDLHIAYELGLQGFDAFFYTFIAYLFDHTLIALLHSLLHLIRRGFEGNRLTGALWIIYIHSLGLIGRRGFGRLVTYS
jgi:hypothetical protein